jgi:hypothetical protein
MRACRALISAILLVVLGLVGYVVIRRLGRLLGFDVTFDWDRDVEIVEVIDYRPFEPNPGDGLADDPIDEAKASDWLASYASDPDFKVDTPVSVPIYFDVPSRKTRLWATLGVRLGKVRVHYAEPPKIRPGTGAGDRQEVKPERLESAEYLIAVGEFAKAEIPGLLALTRREFRDVCNAHKSRLDILEALRRRSP